jgi:multidrug efflux pump
VNIGHLSVRRPVLAIVLSVFLMIAGGLAYLGLPVAEYPEVAPPTVVVQAQYPGASAQVVADTVATPLEQEINGVENMLYMYSQSTADGRMSLTVTFALAPTSMWRRCWCRTVSRSPRRACRRRSGASA